MSNSTESPLSVTFKPHTGYDAPLLTIRADNPGQMVEYLQAVTSNDLLAATGRVAAMFSGQFELGKGLGAQHVNNPDGSGGGSAPVAQAPAPQAVAPPAPVDNGWGQQQAAPQQQQYQQAPPPQQYAPPQAQAAPASPTPPGAPLVLGQPAQYKEGQGKNGTWRAWVDPRSYPTIKHIEQKTDNPSDPGLAAGTHKFWHFIR